jgi:acetylornithine deacetylase/succinyl-diaminopimelate desuccinylase-like protein
VIHAGAELIHKLCELDATLAAGRHVLGGRESCFVGQVHAGEIYNQAPIELTLAGTRRWLSPTRPEEARAQFERLCADVAARRGVRVIPDWHFSKDAYQLDESNPLVAAFQSAHELSSGRRLAPGLKPFVDDGNTYAARGRIPAITHGPNAKGAHTPHEEVPIDELVRVATVYALTAIGFCDPRDAAS